MVLALPCCICPGQSFRDLGDKAHLYHHCPHSISLPPNMSDPSTLRLPGREGLRALSAGRGRVGMARLSEVKATEMPNSCPSSGIQLGSDHYPEHQGDFPWDSSPHFKSSLASSMSLSTHRVSWAADLSLNHCVCLSVSPSPSPVSSISLGLLCSPSFTQSWWQSQVLPLQPAPHPPQVLPCLPSRHDTPHLHPLPQGTLGLRDQSRESFHPLLPSPLLPVSQSTATSCPRECQDPKGTFLAAEKGGQGTWEAPPPSPCGACTASNPIHLLSVAMSSSYK